MTVYDLIRDFWGGVIAAGAGFAWLFGVDHRSRGTAKDSRDEIKRGVERDARLRTLENRAERADERFNSIMALLHRIDKSIEQISRQ